MVCFVGVGFFFLGGQAGGSIISFVSLCIFRVDGFALPCVFQEMILDKVDGKDVPRFLVYDIIKFEVQCGLCQSGQSTLLCLSL